MTKTSAAIMVRAESVIRLATTSHTSHSSQPLLNESPTDCSVPAYYSSLGNVVSEEQVFSLTRMEETEEIGKETGQGYIWISMVEILCSKC